MRLRGFGFEFERRRFVDEVENVGSVVDSRVTIDSDRQRAFWRSSRLFAFGVGQAYFLFPFFSLFFSLAGRRESASRTRSRF